VGDLLAHPRALPVAVALAPAQAGADPRASILTFVRPRRRLTSAPTADVRRRRAQGRSRTRAARRRLVLDGPEHGGMLRCSGAPRARTAPS